MYPVSRLLEALRTLEERGLDKVDADLVVDNAPIENECPIVEEESVFDGVSDSLIDDTLFPPEESAPQLSEREEAIWPEEPLGELSLDSPVEIPVPLDSFAESEVDQPPALRRSVVQEISHVEQMIEQGFNAWTTSLNSSEDSLCIEKEDEDLAKTEARDTIIEWEETVAPVTVAAECKPLREIERAPIEIPQGGVDHSPRLSESAAAMLSLLPSATSLPTWMMIGIDEAKHRLPWVIALAIACSEQLEGALLLIDGDLAGRQLSRRLQVDDQPGLAEVLNETSLIDPLLIPTSSKNLWYLPAGLGSVSPGDYSSAMAEMIEKMGDRFAGVMIDGGTVPPCRKGRIPTLDIQQASRTWLPAMLCEDLFLDVRLGESTESEIQQVVDSIVASGIQPRGCIAV